ncbi:Hypothetical predicted protein [Olea europaea subsp. europaea]|uniref:Uncharacterized protein n=1 Tax=Olea europaea subsp. europaea TaxID=158383 RepID=A0A8S0QUE9_OLEEU|nr:Hypothetical predicted protein [Olea europaea subsp. europaea]
MDEATKSCRSWPIKEIYLVITLRCIKLPVAFQFPVIRQKQGIWNQGNLGKIYAGTVGRHCSLLGSLEARTIYCPMCGANTILQIPQQQYHSSWSLLLRMDRCYAVIYKGHPKTVEGSINDVLLTKNLLVKSTAEEEGDPYRIPTKYIIQTSLPWLIQNGYDEDESLLPVDYKTEGRLLDNEINTTIVRPLPHGATLHAIADTSFSETP